MALSALLRPVRYEDIPGWTSDRPSPAFDAFRRSAFHALAKPYRTGALGIEAGAFLPAWHDAMAFETLDDAAASSFFAKWFTPCLLRNENGSCGFVTGFYEPEADASSSRTERFRYPIYSRPTDLVDLDENSRPGNMDPYYAFGRSRDGEITEYPDRRSIEQGALAGRNLEIAWLDDPVDVFFIHVQGAARLRLPDGIKRITYAAKSGHRFTGPGGVLAELGELRRQEVTMQSIRKWFRDHPNRVNEILWQNRSFIFFREAEVADPSLGPVAAAKVPLTAGRSIAVDRLLHTFGTPIFIDAPALGAFGECPFRRLMIAQDTGSAIVGPARGDLFAGSGDAAGEIAGVVRDAADFYVLVPESLVGAAG